MLIGIYSLRNNRYHPNRRLLEAAKALGQQAVLIHPAKLFMAVDEHGLRADHLGKVFRADVIMPRIGAPIREYALTMVRHFELLGIPLINNFESILLARSKFLTIQTLFRNGIPVPESRYASNWSNFQAALSDLGGFPVVIKTPQTRQGKGVHHVASLDNVKPLLNGLQTGQGLLIQKFIPPGDRRDIRALVVGKSVVGVMALTPRRGDFRANVHLNARMEKIPLTEEISDVAIRSTTALGLDISGVDMIEEKDGLVRVIDVNYAPGFKGLERCTGKDVASEIIKYVISPQREARCRSPF